MTANVKRCRDCGNDIEPLADFPGPRCLDCYRPIGDALFANMTADDLTAMWGGPVRKDETA